MINEYKEMFKVTAELLPNHKNMTQMELAEGYLTDYTYRDCYLAALVLRYWPIITRYLSKDKGLYDEKVAYDWLMDALIYALTEQPWKKETSTVYNDPKAIEKILNTCVHCYRANWFQASNRQKRQANHGTASIEKLKEDYNDIALPNSLIINENMDSTAELVVKYFMEGKYLLALMIDLLVEEVSLAEGFDEDKLMKKLKRSIKTLPDSYLTIFSEKYKIDKKVVEKSLKWVYNVSDIKLQMNLATCLKTLRKALGK